MIIMKNTRKNKNTENNITINNDDNKMMNKTMIHETINGCGP